MAHVGCKGIFLATMQASEVRAKTEAPEQELRSSLSYKGSRISCGKSLVIIG